MKGTPVDLLICNAGVNLDKGQKLESGYPSAMWEATFAANVTGVFMTIQSMLSNLRLSNTPKSRSSARNWAHKQSRRVVDISTAPARQQC